MRLALKIPRAIVFAIVLVKAFPIFNPKGGIPTDLDFELNLEPKQISTYNQTRPRETNSNCVDWALITSLCLLSFAYIAMFTKLC